MDYAEDFTRALTLLSGYDNKLFACEFAKTSEADIRKLSGSTALVVGSEGGFSQQEAEQARQAGFAWVSLGKRILRAETAAVALVSIVAFSLGEMENGV